MEPWLGAMLFNSFLVPGIILVVFLGLLPLFTAIGLLVRVNINYPRGINLYPGRHWSWTFSMYCGIMAIAWIIVQQLLTDYFVLQPFVTLNGLLIIILTISPRVMKYYVQ